MNRSLYLSLITGTITAQSCEPVDADAPPLPAVPGPAPGSVSPTLSMLRTPGFTRAPAALEMLLLALPGRAPAAAGAADPASTERLVGPRSIGEPRCPAAGALVGLRRPMLVLLNPGRRLCCAPAAGSDARMRATCLLSEAVEWLECRILRAAATPLLLAAAAAAAAAAARCAGFGVLLRCAAAAVTACWVKRDCALSALLMRGAEALL